MTQNGGRQTMNANRAPSEPLNESRLIAQPARHRQQTEATLRVPLTSRSIRSTAGKFNLPSYLRARAALTGARAFSCRPD
jgi:hypothetical protein